MKLRSRNKSAKSKRPKSGKSLKLNTRGTTRSSSGKTVKSVKSDQPRKKRAPNYDMGHMNGFMMSRKHTKPRIGFKKEDPLVMQIQDTVSLMTNFKNIISDINGKSKKKIFRRKRKKKVIKKMKVKLNSYSRQFNTKKDK